METIKGFKISVLSVAALALLASCGGKSSDNGNTQTQAVASEKPQVKIEKVSVADRDIHCNGSERH